MRLEEQKFARTIYGILTNNKNAEVPAFLGDLNGTVETGISGLVYVTLFSGIVLKAFNTRVPNISRLPVVVGYEGTDKLHVIRSRDVYPNAPYPDVPNHASLHTFPGADTVPIRSEQFLPGLVTNGVGVSVHVYGTPYELSDGWHVLITQDLDLSGYVPVTGALYALIEADNTGALVVTAGSTVSSRTALVYADIPAADPERFALAAVKLYQGQTTTLFLPTDSDILDLRFGKLGGGGGGLSTMFQRVLAAALSIADGECLVVSGYVNQDSYNITMAGDAVLHIL